MSVLTAGHEAGHVIAAIALGLRVERAVGGRHVDGFMEHHGAATDFDELVVVVGGWVADSLAEYPERDHPFPRFPWCYGVGDAVDALAIARRMDHPLQGGDRAVEEAERILRARWSDVRKLEAALKARGELSGREIARLVGGPQTREKGRRATWS